MGRAKPVAAATSPAVIGRSIDSAASTLPCVCPGGVRVAAALVPPVVVAGRRRGTDAVAAAALGLGGVVGGEDRRAGRAESEPVRGSRAANARRSFSISASNWPTRAWMSCAHAIDHCAHLLSVVPGLKTLVGRAASRAHPANAPRPARRTSSCPSPAHRRDRDPASAPWKSLNPRRRRRRSEARRCLCRRHVGQDRRPSRGQRKSSLSDRILRVPGRRGDGQRRRRADDRIRGGAIVPVLAGEAAPGKRSQPTCTERRAGPVRCRRLSLGIVRYRGCATRSHMTRWVKRPPPATVTVG